MKKIVLLMLSLSGFGLAIAQVPRTISYQGFYTDASGNPVNGTPHKVTFRFFDAVTNTENTNLAREIENITINKGIISVTIGGGDPSHTAGPDNAALPLDVWSQAYKIQVFVDGNSIGEQVPLTTVPYAFVAGSVDGANVTGSVASSKISGTIPGTQIGTGMSASNITTGTLNPSLFTDGSIPGTKLALDINASNIASGTLADSRLEGTLDVTGVNTSGNITTGGGVHVGGTSDPGADNLVVDGTITGNGSGISALNATNISSGTISDSRLETTLDITGVNTAGNITTVGGIHVGGTSDPGIDNLIVDGTITGNGSGISSLNATNISSGTLADARLEPNIDVSGFLTTVGGVHVGGISDPGNDNLIVDGTITGNGSGISSLSATNISSGTLADARLEPNIDVSGFLTTVGGVHVGGTSDPGADNLVVDGSLNVGAAKLVVDANGNITKLNNLTYSFPSTYAASTTFLSNNGSGTLNWTSTLGVANGGTGATTFTGALIGNGTSAVSARAATLGSQYLRRNAGNTDYEFASLSISSVEITDGAISNTDINAAAAIAGTKVAPDFGSQNIISTGTLAVGAGQVSVSSAGYAKLGATGPSVGVSNPVGAAGAFPSIRIYKVTGNCAAADQTATVPVSGITDSKIISIQILVDGTNGFDYIPPGFTAIAGFQFQFNYDGGTVYIRNQSGNSANLAGRPYRIIIMYEE